MVARAILRLKSWSGSKRQPHTALVRAGLDLLAWKYRTRGHFWANSTRAIFDQKAETWRSGQVYRGPADIIGCYHGYHVEFEAKIGKDKLSLHQRNHRDQIWRTRGYHYVFHDTQELESAMADIEARIVGIGGGGMTTNTRKYFGTEYRRGNFSLFVTEFDDGHSYIEIHRCSPQRFQAPCSEAEISEAMRLFEDMAVGQTELFESHE